MVKAAHILQNESIEKTKTNPLVYRQDPMWANGLISASKTAAGYPVMFDHSFCRCLSTVGEHGKSSSAKQEL